MLRYIFSASLLMIALIATACSVSEEAAEPVGRAGEAIVAPPPEETTWPQTPEPGREKDKQPGARSTVKLPPVVAPGVPQIIHQLDFALPAGNGRRPRRVTVDTQRQRVYLFNEGAPSLNGGNTVSVFDLKSNQFTNLIKLNNHLSPENNPPTPLALTPDPYRPRLYAVWGDLFDSEPDNSALSIIDTEALCVVDTLFGVEAMASGPDRLMLVNNTRLWAIDPNSLQHTCTEPDQSVQGANPAALLTQKLEPARYNGPIRLTTHAGGNRLYLGRGRPWRVETFAADSLKHLNSYPLDGDLKEIIIDEENAQLLVFERVNGQIVRHSLNLNGEAVTGATEPPAKLPVDVYGNFPVATLGQAYYTLDLPYPEYRLSAFDRLNFTPQKTLPLPCSPNDLTADPAANLIYAVCSGPDSVLLAINPASGNIQTHYTALSIIDALANPEQNRLYVINNQGMLYVLNLNNYSKLAQIQTEFNAIQGQMTGGGKLALDTGRNRLYIGGNPVHIIDTRSLKVVERLDASGQLTPDPTRDRLYLTPPCRCRLEQCNTFILNAQTLSGTQTLFPPKDPFTAPCVVSTRLDAANQLLYARIDNGVPGSNAGFYYTVFNVAGGASGQILYTSGDISFGNVTFDPPGKRAFASRYRINRGFIHRFEAQNGVVTQTLELVAAEGELAYDPAFDRLYAVQNVERDLQVFDGNLALLADLTLPGDFSLLDFDSANQRLYLNGVEGELLIVATGGGGLQAPPGRPKNKQATTQQLIAAPNGALFRIYNQQLYRSDNGGNTWTLLGQGLPGRQVGVIALSPDYQNDQTLLAGLWSYGWAGGLYRSSDGGNTWQPTTRGLTDLEVGQIAYSPTFTQDQTIFVTTFDRGLFRSGDGGNTWASLAAAYAGHLADVKVDRVAVSPNFNRDGLVFISRRNLWRSDDGGNTWTDTGLPGGLIAFSPNFSADGLILLGGRWRSTNAGRTWEPAAAGREATLVGSQDILFSPDFAADQTVYLTFKADYDAALSLQRSTDAGRSWQSLLGDNFDSNFTLNAVTILADGNLYLTARDGSARQTSPSVLTWGSLPADIAALDLQSLVIAPNGGLFVANGVAGVFKSSDAGRTWSETGFPARAGAHHSAHLAMSNNGILFAAVGTALERSNNNGASWFYLSNLPSGFEISALAVSPNFSKDNIVFMGGNYVQNDLLRSNDGGQSWKIVFKGAAIQDSSDVIAIAFSPDFANDQTVYAWLQYGGLLRSGDGGLNWERAPSEQYEGYFAQSMAVSPVDGRVFIGTLDGHLLVWPGEDNAWLDLQNNIPDDRAWSSALTFGPDGSLFLGTDKGVYRTGQGAQTWTQASHGLPLRQDEPVTQAVRALQFSPEGSLYATLAKGGVFVTGNQGQGWRSALEGKKHVIPSK